jgi:mannosyltransferase
MAGSRVARLVYLGIILVGFGLRVYRLGTQSLWYDEGFSVWLAGQSLPAITFGDFNPPLYHYLLHFWVQAAGTTEFAVRYLSVFFGLLTVAATFALGTALFGPAAGLAGAALTAVSPFLIWYSQEARMYALAVLLGVLASWLVWKGFSGRRLWPAYALTVAAGAYTHYLSLLVPLGHTVFAAARALDPKQRPAFKGWVLAGVGSALAYLPWVPVALWHAGFQTYWAGRPDVLGLFQDAAARFVAGFSLETDRALAFGYAFFGLAAAGLLAAALVGPKARAGGFLLGLVGLLPLGIILGLAYYRPKFEPRYLIFVWPALALLGVAPLGLAVGLRPWPLRLLAALPALMTVLAVGIPAAVADYNLYTDPRYGKDVWREVGRYLAEWVGNDEVVVLDSGHAFRVFVYYYRKSNWVALPPDPPPSPLVDRPLGPEVGPILARFVQGRRGVWVVRWQDRVADPTDIVRTMLDRVGYLTPVPPLFGAIRVEHYVLAGDLRELVRLEPQYSLGWKFRDEIELVGYDLYTVDRSALGFVFYWRALGVPSAVYKVSVRIVDGERRILAQEDGWLAGEFYLTPMWRPGNLVLGRLRLPVPPELPAGRYGLDLVFYRADLSWSDDVRRLGTVDFGPTGR